MRENFFNDRLNLHIKTDPSSQLPLLSEEGNILALVMNYLTLPYSVSEYGCGNKANLIIKKLIDLGLPAFSLYRGMIMERDMSDTALYQTDYHKRKHSLTVENALYHKVNFEEEVLFKQLEEEGIYFDERNEIIKTGTYHLSHEKTLQFIKARSHIFVVVCFWDEKSKSVKERVVDPTLDTEECFLISQMRKYLQASEALIFKAPLLGYFKLEERYLTEDQNKQLRKFLNDRTLTSLGWSEHRKLVLELTGGSEDSIADPKNWSYSNNIALESTELSYYQRVLTGEGELIRGLFNEMSEARLQKNEELVVSKVQEMHETVNNLNIIRQVAKDARESETALEPLTIFTETLSNHISLRELSERFNDQNDLTQSLMNPFGLDHLHGIGFRLRHRIDDMAAASKNDKGQIDARALNKEYRKATVECIRQMNKAGLKVFIDKVGNIHGLLIDEKTYRHLLEDINRLKDLCETAIAHCSHIDTVMDGGMYDGRLGVLSGIEVAEIMHDLQRFYDMPGVYPSVKRPLLVSAYVGEEMTFTGQGVSMPGSAAVSTAASVERIYKMVNAQGEYYEQALKDLMAELMVQEKKGAISFYRPKAVQNGVSTLLKSLPDPHLFFTEHTYERHIEQGKMLDDAKTPLVLVNVIMGIHQEDTHFKGKFAEEAAVRMNLLLREKVKEKQFESMRVTAGILQVKEVAEEATELDYGFRWTLVGKKDHAGSALLKDRQDAGVAVARLVKHFAEMVEEKNPDKEKVQLVIGAVEVLPGTNRNVIPEVGRVTLGLVNNGMKEKEFKELAEQLHYDVQGYITGVLYLPVEVGGEGILEHHSNQVNYVNLGTLVRMSMDLRSDSADNLRNFKEEISKERKRISKDLKVEFDLSIEQELQHYSLEDTGQVLQLERSFGGSHNPNETELSRDLLLGTLLQLHTSNKFVNEDKVDNLYEMVLNFVPEEWKDNLPYFVSGALHDTCNISQNVREKMKAEETKSNNNNS